MFLASAEHPPLPEPGTAFVVLDTAWTPGPGERPDVLSVRPYLDLAIEQHDLFEDALERLDAWATKARLADRLLVDGVTYWFRVRETMWRWLHERMLWWYAVDGMLDGGPPPAMVVPPAEEALADVLGWSHGDIATRAPEGEAEPVPRAPEAASGGTGASRSVVQRLLGRAGLRPSAGSARTAEVRRRESILGDRVSRLAQLPGPRVLVLTTPATHTRIGTGGASERRDPYFGAVIPRLIAAGMEPVLFGLGFTTGSDDDWATMDGDARLLPQSLLRTRWSDPADDAHASRVLASCDAALDDSRTVALRVGDVDIAPAIVEALRSVLARTITTDARQVPRLRRLLDELKPDAILLAQEGIRIPWLVAARSAAVPVFAVQHGILYPTHPGYPITRHAASVLPSCTFVYGDFSRRVLLGGAYLPVEVEVSGSPRLDLDTEAGADDPVTDRADERESVRRELGIAGSDRLLVVSTVNLEFVRRSHLVHMIERTIGGPLPGVHVVFKQHPGEQDEGPYRELVAGLARAGGYGAPPVSVVRDIDLYRLLRAADAHLGLHSTVLTDAVAAGTPNLIAIVEGHADLIGYVAAGVARPVRDVAEVLAALADPPHADPAARRAFLDDHFRPGNASERIVAAIEGRIGHGSADA